MYLRELLLPELDARLRWTDRPGDLPARVFLHGLGCAAEDFSAAVAHPRLAGNRALLVDLLGFGRSDRPAGFRYGVADHAAVVARLLDELGLTACDVIGHSMGGTIAIALAADRPDLVSRLVLAEPNLTGAGGLSNWIADQPEDVYVRAGHRMVTTRLGGAADSAQLAYRANLARSAPLAVHRSAVALVGSAAAARRQMLERLPMRRAYLVGERSLPDSVAEEAAAHGIPVVVVPGAGHLMMHDATDAFAAALSTVLRDE